MAGISSALLGLLLLCLQVPDILAVYYGTEIGSLVNKEQHGVSGTVYAVSADTLRLVNFNYDGTGPQARFYVGTSSGGPAVGGTTVPDESGSTDKLGAYTNRKFMITLPAGINMDDLRWFSVWCTQFNMDFGSVLFPSGFKKPGPQLLGQFGLTNPRAHGFRSGDVTVVNSKNITIKAVHYDGRGPDAFFILDKDTRVGHSGYDKLKDEFNSTSKVKEYRGKDIELVLPSGISIHDGYKFLSLYCIRFSQDFGNLPIPAQLNVPLHPVTLQEETKDGSSELDNCESLSDDFNVGWSVNTTHITFEFVSSLADGRYMAFGLSGSDNGVSMIGGDVIVTRFTAGNPYAEDYYLQSYAQCSLGTGACPDTMSGGNQDARVIGGSKVDGVVRVMVTRVLDTGDTKDKPYTPNVEQSIIWALGGLNDETFVTKHDQRIVATKKIMFGRASARNCGSIAPPTTFSGEVWKEQKLSGRDVTDGKFYVKIGPPGGDKGYKAITGNQAWGIAYYINKLLIPELELKRGNNYTFIIEAGSDISNTAKYHPFYLTDDPRGGYGQLSQDDQDKYQVYLGIDPQTRQPKPDAVGRYCEYTAAGGLEAEESSRTFADFQRKLSLSCEPGQTGRLDFYVDPSLPDLIYYQCVAHFRLGWKIRIVDEYTSSVQPLLSNPNVIISSIFITLIVTSHKAVL